MKQLLTYAVFLVVTFQLHAQSANRNIAIQEGLSYNGQAGKNSGKKKIYSAVLTEFYEGNPANIIINETTVNTDIVNTNYAEIAESYRDSRKFDFMIDKVRMDSSWIPSLLEANIKKHALKQYKIPVFSTDKIATRFISGDSIKWSYSHGGFENVFKVRERVNLSDIILFKKRAIVEMTRHCGSLCGEGRIYFLEKKRGKWVIVSSMLTWIS